MENKDKILSLLTSDNKSNHILAIKLARYALNMSDDDLIYMIMNDGKYWRFFGDRSLQIIIADRKFHYFWYDYSLHFSNSFAGFSHHVCESKIYYDFPKNMKQLFINLFNKLDQ